MATGEPKKKAKERQKERKKDRKKERKKERKPRKQKKDGCPRCAFVLLHARIVLLLLSLILLLFELEGFFPSRLQPSAFLPRDGVGGREEEASESVGQ